MRRFSIDLWELWVVLTVWWCCWASDTLATAPLFEAGLGEKVGRDLNKIPLHGRQSEFFVLIPVLLRQLVRIWRLDTPATDTIITLWSLHRHLFSSLDKIWEWGEVCIDYNSSDDEMNTSLLARKFFKYGSRRFGGRRPSSNCELL